MDESELRQHIAELKEKLHRVQRRNAGLREKSKLLDRQYEDAQRREGNTNDLVMELLERQRELNVMLNRANIMLNRTQEAMALTSMEFNEMAKALPEPQQEEWSDRIAKVNELFKKTGIQDAEVVDMEDDGQPLTEPFSPDEMKKHSDSAFGRKESFWTRKTKHEPEQLEAEIVDEEEDGAPDREAEPTDEIPAAACVEDKPHEEPETVRQEVDADADKLIFPPKRKSWLHRAFAGN